MLSLLADTGDGKTAMIIAITGTVSVVLTKIVDRLWELAQDGNKRQQAAKDKIEDHLETRIARLEVENERCERRVNRMGRRLRIQENSTSQMKAYIQGLPKNKGLPIYVEVPLDPEEPDDVENSKPITDTHQKLQPNELKED